MVFIPAKALWLMLGGLVAAAVLFVTAGFTALSSNLEEAKMAANCQQAGSQEAIGTVLQNDGETVTIRYSTVVSDDTGKHEVPITNTFTPCSGSEVSVNWPKTDYQVRIFFSGDYLKNVAWIGGP